MPVRVYCCHVTQSDNLTTTIAIATDICIAGILLRLSKCGASTCHGREGLNLIAACRLLDSHRGKDVVVTIGAAVLLSHRCSIRATYVLLYGSVLGAAMLLCGIVD